MEPTGKPDLPGPESANEQKANFASPGPAYSRQMETSRYGAHRLVVDLVGKGKRVLDIGSGEGALAAHLAAVGNEVIAVERDARLASAATKRGVHVVNRDIEHDDLEDLGLFDVIVCADVLEHLVEPELALFKIKRRLAPGGSLVCSIPNVAFYPVRFKLLLGRFRYIDGGIMDRTHLHFYTRATAKEFIEGAGFKVTREEISLFLPLGFRPLTIFVNRLLEGKRLGPVLYKCCQAFPGFFAFQFISESIPT